MTGTKYTIIPYNIIKKLDIMFRPFFQGRPPTKRYFLHLYYNNKMNCIINSGGLEKNKPIHFEKGNSPKTKSWTWHIVKMSLVSSDLCYVYTEDLPKVFKLL